MTEREQKLRELITRVRKPDSNVSPEYNLLSVADAGFMLELLDQARGGTGYHEVARGIADLVVEKQAAYGDSFGKSGEVMRLLYPEGVKPEQLPDALTVVRVLDKLFRIATKRDAFGEDPWHDVLGYALLAVERRRRSREPLRIEADIGEGTGWRLTGRARRTVGPNGEAARYYFEREGGGASRELTARTSNEAWAELRRLEGLPPLAAPAPKAEGDLHARSG